METFPVSTLSENVLRICSLRKRAGVPRWGDHAAYTITHAIEDRNVLRFHVDYYKPKDTSALKPGQTLTKQAVAQAILDKHDAATGGRRFNALLATASINDAIEYYEVF
jgi:type I restriction enzyme R subunit